MVRDKLETGDREGTELGSVNLRYIIIVSSGRSRSKYKGDQHVSSCGVSCGMWNQACSIKGAQ